MSLNPSTSCRIVQICAVWTVSRALERTVANVKASKMKRIKSAKVKNAIKLEVLCDTRARRECVCVLRGVTGGFGQERVWRSFSLRYKASGSVAVSMRE